MTLSNLITHCCPHNKLGINYWTYYTYKNDSLSKWVSQPRYTTVYQRLIWRTTSLLIIHSGTIRLATPKRIFNGIGHPPTLWHRHDRNTLRITPPSITGALESNQYVSVLYHFAGYTGVEPAPYAVTGRHLNRLTYSL